LSIIKLHHCMKHFAHQTADKNSAPPVRPRSASDFALSLIAWGLALGLVWAIAPWRFPNSITQNIPYLPIIPCFGVAIVFAITHRLDPPLQATDNYDGLSTARGPVQWQRVGTRLYGLIATFALVASIYWVLPEYHGDFYEPFWRFLRTLAPLAILIPPYLIWADRRFYGSSDEYLEFGKLALGRWVEVNPAIVRQHALGWLVKAFFLPLMTVYLYKEVSAFYAALQEPAGPLHNYQLMFHLSYMTDLLFAVVGYTLTLRLFDSHTRSVEPTMLGWVVALMCYQPFYSAISHAYLTYEDGIYWDNLLGPWPVLRTCWGVVIVCLTLVYGLATAAFGVRFSNLTNRGIITGGPYRFTKHPAYLSKNLSWWLISVPMFSNLGWPMAVRNCCILGLLNLIYYARARTEERHLSRDPTYVAYALWIEQHGLLAPLANWLPFIRFRFTDGLTSAGCGEPL
jgi:protein-S-isoprenylcysteine O-methyltransferase Ste14